MFYFGKPPNSQWLSAFVEPTPNGAHCAWCDELIIFGDNGFLLPAVGEIPNVIDIPTFEGIIPCVAYHRACLLRQILGSLSHCQRQCSCYIPGATCTDPPEMTLRGSCGGRG